jgi:glycosyltransferase EpsE
MKVSIITSAYNCGKYIEETIDSLICQTYQDWELIIGDDGSTDDTKFKIDTYDDARIKRYHSDENIGLLRMTNHLLSKATGDFFMTQDADDISAPTRIEAQLAVFSTFPDVSVCGTNCMFFGEFIAERVGNTEAQEGYMPHDYTGLPFAPASIMYKREVYELVGGFHPYFDRLSSMDQYWIYLMREKFMVYYLNQPLYFARMHPGSNHRSVEMSDIKKLASWDVYKLLRYQRETTGTDSLERGAVHELDNFVEKLGKDRKWLSGKLREYSATKADVGDTRGAIVLGAKAVAKWPWAAMNYRTLLYSIRKHFVK